MIAVIETGGKQYLIQPGVSVKIEKLPAAVGETVTFDKVLMIANEDGTGLKIGTPYIEGGAVTASISLQSRTKKILVVKYKRKVRYTRVHGHRQHVTTAKIESVGK